jgi:glycosyltransferase involved in cell wall biosynthesis
MRILIATDAWRPQVNGVVRSLEAMTNAAKTLGAEFEFLTPRDFFRIPMPTYPEIELAFATSRAVERRLARGYDHIHIATEGPVGRAARACCLRQRRRFTTSYHTRFPEYIEARTHIPASFIYGFLRRFHNAAAGVMVSTPGLAQELSTLGFRGLRLWSRGVDHEVFHPRAAIDLDLPRPIFLYAGRLAVEKNIDAFLSLKLPGSKVVVGDGPERKRLEAAYPEAHFLGLKGAKELAGLYAASDVFVFPSRTDTFGMVLLEALACGLPVAAFPVAGPRDVIGESGAGALDEDLRRAALSALRIPREAARAHALTFNWNVSARQFLDNVVAAHGGGAIAPTSQSRNEDAPRGFGESEMAQP